MPYTPPSRSPTETRPHTPRTASHEIPKTSSPEEKKDTASKTYLSKHRRSPSATESLPLGESRQVKPTENNVSNSPASSDDEPSQTRPRVREFANLAELQAAIRIIEQHRAGSPNEDENQETREARALLGLPEPRVNNPKSKPRFAPEASTTPPLADTARKITHSRSATDASAFFDFPRNKSESPASSRSRDDSDAEDEEEQLTTKPVLIRKKSGELVRPALRGSSTRRRPSSMPGTPTYSKAVHFQESSLEHVRHFLQVDRPIAVSAGSSPVEAHDEDMEFPFGDYAALTPPFDWEIKLPNFNKNAATQARGPVKVERVHLSSDTKVLIGTVAVRNLAFHKRVAARFTLDYWKTTSEVLAEYNSDVRKKFASDGYDRFTFSIKLEDQANLENKTMFFCMRYSVEGQEYWDNNGSHNYQVDFSKKYKPQNGKPGLAKSSNSLPRSKPSLDALPKMRPRTMPSFDDFSVSTGPYDFSSFQPSSTMVGETPIRFKNKQVSERAPPAPTVKDKATGQQAFGNRYDFGASLSAAIQAASKEMGEKPAPMPTPNSAAAPKNPKLQPPVASESTPQSKTSPPSADKPSALTATKPSLQSPSYHELLDKYCFFGSSKPTAPAPKVKASNEEVATKIDGAPKVPPSTPAATTTSKSVEPPVSSPPRTISPPSSTEDRRARSSSSRASGSTSPATGSAYGSRTASPGAFGYSYHQRLQTGFFETHTPTAIQG